MQHYRGTKKSAAPTKASDMIKWIDKSGFVYHSSHSKVKVIDSTNFGNHTFNSRTAVVIAN